jgi:putative transposase
MARLARLVVPGVPHHVTQRGNRRQEVFFDEEDHAACKALVAEACAENGVRCLAWCLIRTTST